MSSSTHAYARGSLETKQYLRRAIWLRSSAAHTFHKGILNRGSKSPAAWRTELHRNRSIGLDAPSWLWSSVAVLVAHHESAYLEHCRQFALAAA